MLIGSLVRGLKSPPSGSEDLTVERRHPRANEVAPLVFPVSYSEHDRSNGVQACRWASWRAFALCWLAERCACAHVACAGVHIGLLACTWVAQAYRRDIPGFQTDVHACSLMPTKSIQYCRRAASIEDQQGTVPCEQLPLQAEETRLLSCCKRKCQREEVRDPSTWFFSPLHRFPAEEHPPQRGSRPSRNSRTTANVKNTLRLNASWKKSMAADGRKATVK